jgi:hypothetical protein
MAHVNRYVVEHVYPVAVALLPAEMWEREAFAMLTAIGFQESAFTHRRQLPNGPARGFWQFELGGTEGVLEHPASRDHAAHVLAALSYNDYPSSRDVHLAIEHNDVLACCFARLLLWTDPRALPSQGKPTDGWLQYLATWRPGKPHQSTWAGNFARAWSDEPWTGMRA